MTEGGAGNLLKAIVGLSGGTLLARGLSAVSQLLLAIWLSPAEFGLWAAANSILAFVAGLTNFGEVNGYISGHGSGFLRARRNTRLMNLALVAAGAIIAVVYLVNGRPQVALLAAIIALTIPFTGEGDLLYATSVKLKSYRRAVVSQSVGAIAKIGIGVLIAITTQSAVAIALSILASSIVVNAVLHPVGRRAARTDSVVDAHAPSHRERLSWAVNSWMMTVPLQSGFVVAQFLASPALLGLYYLSYQVTLAISGVLSGPISRVVLSTLGDSASGKRARLAADLCHLLGAMLLFVAATLALALPFIEPIVSPEWSGALPATAILLASLPARIMTPVVDALQQSQGRWWRSTAFNVIDAVGTALCAVALVTGDLILFASILTAWKTLFCLVRMLTTLAGARARAAGAAIVATLGSVLVVFSAILDGAPAILIAGSAMLLALLWLASRHVKRWK